MTRRIVTASLLVLAASIGAQGRALAQPGCTNEAAWQRQSLREAVRLWQASHHAWLEPSFQTAIAVDFCNATARLIAERRATSSQIDRVAVGTVEDYLQPYLDDRPSPTLSAALRTRLGVQGLFRPYARSKGTIMFTYRRLVDTLVVGQSSLGPVMRVIVSPGPTRFRGSLGTQLICQGAVTVIAARTVQAVC